MRDELVDLLERAGIEQQVDALARRELAGVVLPLQPLLAAAQLGAPLEVLEMRRADPSACYALAACAFSQSFRNFSSPMSVSGCLKQRLDHRRRARADVGAHAAPPRRCGSDGGTLATSTSVVNS